MNGADRVALITGASRGLGKFLACTFHARGFRLVLTARSEAALDALRQELAASPAERARIITVAADMASPQSAQAAADAVERSFGRVDCLICNAAIQGPIGSFRDIDFEAWRSTVDVDLIAQARLTKAVLPHMSAGASIIYLSGGGATGPRPFFSAYGTAKAGLVRFGETLAHELQAADITVNCIAPGPMPTAMMREIDQAGARAGRREQDMAEKALAASDDVMKRAADLAFFLASNAARGITGRLISAVWDRYDEWPDHLDELAGSDVYTLRRIAGRDRGFDWGDR